eukprot:m.30895 g.30895  ORF g.30895 m.30895 type:complete len:297 (+) comp12013_c0_seq1:263-1153(+)
MKKDHPRSTQARCLTISAISLILLGALLVLVAVSVDLWSTKDVNIPNGRDLGVGRGVFSMRLYSARGMVFTFLYHVNDINGQNQDPYCGSANATSVFQQYLSVMNDDPGAPGTRQLPNDVCCNDTGTIFKPHRDDDTNSWCSAKRSTAGLAITTLALAVLSVLLLYCACGSREFLLLPAAVIAGLSTILGIAALSVFLQWLYREREDIDDRSLPSEATLESGPSLIAFAVGILCLAFGAVLEGLAYCCRHKTSDKAHPINDIHRQPHGAGNSGYEQQYTGRSHATLHRHVSQASHV